MTNSSKDLKTLKSSTIYTARWLAKQSPEYIEKRKAAAKKRANERYANDPTYRQRKLDAQKKWSSSNPVQAQERRRRTKLRTRYGLTQEVLLDMLEKQSSLCAICKDEISTDTLHIDHDHKNNMVRALLCGPCNQGLGLFREAPQRLRNAANYIEYYLKSLG